MTCPCTWRRPESLSHSDHAKSRVQLFVQWSSYYQTLSPLSRCYQCSAFHVEFTVLGNFSRKAINTYGLIERVIKGGGKEKRKSRGFKHTVCTVFIATCSTAMPFLPGGCRKRLNPVATRFKYSLYFWDTLFVGFGGFFATVKHN